MEIRPGIHQIDGVTGNAYVIIQDKLIITDTGITGSGKTILLYIRDTLHREPADIRTVILTHFHTDHIGGVRVLKKAAPGLKTAVHEADAGYVAGTMPLPCYPGLRGLVLSLFIRLRPPFILPDIVLKDGDRTDGLICVHLPGHTPGSIGLLDESSKTLFAGDTIGSDGTSLSERARFMMDLPRSRELIRKIASLEFDTLLIGHGKPVRPDAAVKVRKFIATRSG